MPFNAKWRALLAGAGLCLSLCAGTLRAGEPARGTLQAGGRWSASEHGVCVSWTRSGAESYRVSLSSAVAGGPFAVKTVASSAECPGQPFWLAGNGPCVSFPGLSAGVSYSARVEALDASGFVLGEAGATISPPGPLGWLDLRRLNSLLLLLVFAGVFGYCILRAGGRSVRVRRLAAMDAMESAVLQSARLGRPVLYVTGVGQAYAMPTVASVSILGELARTCARCGARLLVPHYDPVVLGICREAVRKAYDSEGRSPSEGEACNFFVSQDQFSFVAAVDGLISREKPGACFYMGQFMAESLLLTEVGAASGAVQVAGTDAESQLPFFYASCDHTLVGEEFYAAGACLSRRPLLLGSLRAQDLLKAFGLGLAACVLCVVIFSALCGRADWARYAMELLRAF